LGSLSDTELRKQYKKNLNGPRGPDPAAVRIFTELHRRYEERFGPSPKTASEQTQYYRKRFAFCMTDKELEEHYRTQIGKRSRDDRLWKQYFEEELNRRKESKMAKEKKAAMEEQMDLIDVAPENAKEIIKEARIYKKHESVRLQALDKELVSKNKVLELIKQAKLQPVDGGKIKFTYDGVTITVTPRDELLKVKEDEKAPSQSN